MPVTASTGCSPPGRRAENKPTFVQARHEEMAAFQAVGYAKFSGRVGVCTATSGPGAVHLLNGLYDAKLDHVPVVADRRADQPVRHGRQLPAGDRPAVAVQGRGQRVLPDGHRPRAAAERAGPGHPDREQPAHGDRRDHSRRRAGAGLLGAVARVQDGALQPGPDLGGAGAERGRPAARRGAAERRQQGGHAGRPGSTRRGRRGDRDRGGARCRRGQGAARQGRSPRRR